MEKLPWESVVELQDKNRFVHAKQCYLIAPASMAKLRGCKDGMASYMPRKQEEVSTVASKLSF